MRHDGVDVGVGDGSVLAAENLVGTEPQRVQQLLLAQLAEQKRKKTSGRTATNELVRRKLRTPNASPSAKGRLKAEPRTHAITCRSTCEHKQLILPAHPPCRLGKSRLQSEGRNNDIHTTLPLCLSFSTSYCLDVCVFVKSPGSGRMVTTHTCATPDIFSPPSHLWCKFACVTSRTHSQPLAPSPARSSTIQSNPIHIHAPSLRCP